MSPVFCIATSMVTPIGLGVQENFQAIINNVSGISIYEKHFISDKKFGASLFKNKDLQIACFSFFESLLIHCIQDLLHQSNIKINSRTGIIISSTKGNIALLEDNQSTDTKKSISLIEAAKKVAGYFNMLNQPIVISQACISGVVAMITAKRLIENNQYDDVIVVGADTITKFVLSGFQSFHAVSEQACKPFDADRDGINLGEAAAGMVLSKNKSPIIIAGGAVSNDANHISGPSRTGAELHQAIEAAIHEAAIEKYDIDFISAHGTATIFNDDMESKAFHLSQLQQIPVNSLKGYFGHTLGAAGLLETVISIASLQHNIILPTKGYTNPGTEQPINICASKIEKPIYNFLKTASGFGGCNAAIIVKKINERL